MSSAICFNLDQSKILSSGNGLTQTFCGWLLSELKLVPEKQKISKYLLDKCPSILKYDFSLPMYFMPALAQTCNAFF